MKVLSIGLASYDITFPLDHYPVEDLKIRVPVRIENGGGPAATAAYLMGSWGLETYFMGVIGNDDFGHAIKTEFDKVNVNTKFLEITNDFKTTSAMVIVNTELGTRTILNYRDERIKLTDTNLDFAPDVILMDGQEYDMSKKLLLAYPNAISIIDASRPVETVLELSHMVNYLVCAKKFAESVTGITIDFNNKDTMISIMTAMEAEFKNTIVITLEDQGSLARINGKVKWFKPIKTAPLDTTGAGDIFHGAFTYGIANNLPLDEIIKKSNIAGGLSVNKIGSRNSIPTLEEVNGIYNGNK